MIKMLSTVEQNIPGDRVPDAWSLIISQQILAHFIRLLGDFQLQNVTSE
jgi:hypothetical protein